MLVGGASTLLAAFVPPSPRCTMARPGGCALFFEGFGLRHVEEGGGALRVRVGGSGPPLLLLHGNPQAHAMWHRVAPAVDAEQGRTRA